MENNLGKFGKSFSRFCFCTSRISNCRVECIWKFQVGRNICKHLVKWFANNQMKDSTCKWHSSLSLCEPYQIKFGNLKTGSHSVFPTSFDTRLETCFVKAQS